MKANAATELLDAEIERLTALIPELEARAVESRRKLVELQVSRNLVFQAGVSAGYQEHPQAPGGRALMATIEVGLEQDPAAHVKPEPPAPEVKVVPDVAAEPEAVAQATANRAQRRAKARPN